MGAIKKTGYTVGGICGGSEVAAYIAGGATIAAAAAGIVPEQAGELLKDALTYDTQGLEQTIKGMSPEQYEKAMAAMIPTAIVGTAGAVYGGIKGYKLAEAEDRGVV